MQPFARYFLCIALAFTDLSCSVNILTTFADTKTNEALYEDAIANVNAGDYSAALTNIAAMTGSYPTTTKVLELKASAYAGICGLQFMPFVNAFSGMGATLLFPFLLKNFDFAASGNITECVAAQTVLQSIGAVANRSADDNFFSAVVALATIGNILSFYADPGKTGTATPGWDPCAVGVTQTAGGSMTDTDARNIGASMAIAVADLTAVAGVVNVGSGTLTMISNLCSVLPATYDFCGVTDPTALTIPEVKGVRSLVKENAVVGLGSNCTGDVSVCFCP